METKDEIIKNGGKIDLIKKEITSENDAVDLIGKSINFLEDVENQQFTLINNASVTASSVVVIDIIKLSCEAATTLETFAT